MSRKFSDYRIVIYTRSCNSVLYSLSSQTFKLPYELRKINFSTADGYFYDILRSDADIVINIDEDAFILNNQNLFELLEYFIENGYVNCGMPDGGVVPIRKHNPLITNPFFNILNLREIRKFFTFEKLESFRHWKHEYSKIVSLNMLKFEYTFDMYEPYSAFFIMLSQMSKVLYLNADVHNDKISTILLDHQNRPFLVHSWYSRYYGRDVLHTNRIKSLVKEVGLEIPNKDRYLIDGIKNDLIFPLIIKIRGVLRRLGLRKYN